MQVIVKSTLNDEQLTTAQRGDMFSGLTEDFDPASIEMMYMFSDSIKNADPTWTMTLETLFNHMVNNVIEDATIAAIVRTISIGSFCAIMLILFVLPGILATCDKLVIRKKHRIKKSRYKNRIIEMT